jgi:hypothetical protein
MFIDELNEKILETYEILIEKEQDLQTLKTWFAPNSELFKVYCEIQYLKLKLKVLKVYMLLDKI